MTNHSFRYDNSWLAGEDRLGRQSLVTLLLSDDDSDGLVAEPAALELARRDLYRLNLAASAHMRRAIPPRRHLRS